MGDTSEGGGVVVELDQKTQPDGKIDAFLTGTIGRNWRTTVTSVFTAVCGFIALKGESLEMSPLLVEAAVYLTLGGVVGMGAVSKDSKVSGKPK